MTGPRNDAKLWAEIAGLFHAAGCGTEDRLRFARMAIAIVRRERGDGPTYAPGEDVPLTVTTVFDVDGSVWDRQSTDPASGLAPVWKMRGFDPAEHESPLTEIRQLAARAPRAPQGSDRGE